MALIKFIGIIIAVIGLILLILVIMSGRRSNISGIKAELDMITGAGYATTHTAQRQTRSVLETTPVKVPPRRRALSREAADILKKVEEEREAERNSLQQKPERKMKKPVRERKGTAILPTGEEKAKGTAVLEENKRPSKGTAVLGAADNKPSKGTDVLPQKRSQIDTSRRDNMTPQKRASSPKGTDILGTPKKKAPDRTDILTSQDRTERDAKRGTAVLEAKPAAKTGTAVLQQGEREGMGTDVPETRRGGGTEVLPEKKQGTSVLMPESSAPKQSEEDRRRNKSAKRKKGGFGTAVLEDTKRNGTGVLPQKGTAVLSERKED